tara:strand:- start:27558 stop:29315 length:1758 start_codon:yes stop_codon:yes gene_type:complete
MKILLACTSIQDGHRVEDAHDSHYPLGLAYLQSYLEMHRPDQDEFVNLYLNNVNYQDCYRTIKDNLKKFKPDVFGVSLMTHSRVSAYKMIEYVHEHYPDIKIVVGGMHVTVMWHQLIEKYPYITAVRGEGEITFHKLIDAYESGGIISDIPGLAYHDGEEVFTTGNASLIDDLDDLPFPKHSLFVNEGKTMANLLTSRGCPYKCNFCVLDWMSRRKVRFRSGDNIADEVEMILKKWPSITTIWIHDDAFMINRDRTIEFCDAIIRRGIKTQFVASARFRPISDEVVSKMEQAGFAHVLFGLESGADEVIKGMQKGITKDHVRYGLELFGRTRMKATAFLIAGLPGETDETIDETINFVQELQNINYLFYDDIGVAMMYPGTEMYGDARTAGKISDDYWLTDNDVPYYTIENGGVHTYEKLLQMKDKIRIGVSLQNIFTPHGFLLQRKLIPKILEYAQQYGMSAMNNMLGQVLFDTGLIHGVIHAFFLGKSESLSKKIHLAVEKSIITNVLERIQSGQHKAEFAKDYELQLASDKETMKLYEERRKKVLEELSSQDDLGDIKYTKKAVKENAPKKLDFDVSTAGGV